WLYALWLLAPPPCSSHFPYTTLFRSRYAAFAMALQSGEALVLAHHADDQAETFLLQALRGAGVAGLAAMPEWTAFGGGYLWRPLDRKSTRLNSSHVSISYAVFCLKRK